MLGIGEGTQGGLFIKTIWKFAWERKMPNCIQLTNLARDVSGRLLMGPPQSLCQSLCFGLIIEPTSIFFNPQFPWFVKVHGPERVEQREKEELAELPRTPKDCPHLPSQKSPPTQQHSREEWQAASSWHVCQTSFTAPHPQKDQVQFGLTQSPFEPCLSD